MAIYIEYERLKKRYLDAQKQFDDVLVEKEELFERTQPRGIKYDKDKTCAMSDINSFDSFLIAQEKARIDERLDIIRSILEDRSKLLELKEKELRKSRGHVDRIYCMKYFDNLYTEKIAKSIGYSESYLYRILASMKRKLDRIKLV